MLTGRDIVPDVFFEEVWTEREERADYLPALELVERESDILLQFELPGVSKDDTRVIYEEGTMIVQGEKKMEELTGTQYYNTERSFGTFVRTIALNEQLLETNRISARLKDGVLSVHIHKKHSGQEAARTIVIEL